MLFGFLALVLAGCLAAVAGARDAEPDKGKAAGKPSAEDLPFFSHKFTGDFEGMVKRHMIGA
jgi:hypothetical protein